MRKKIERRRLAFQGIMPTPGKLSKAKGKQEGITAAYKKRKSAILTKFNALTEIEQLRAKIVESGKKATDLAGKNNAASEEQMVDQAIKNNALLFEFGEKLLELNFATFWAC